MNFFIKEILLSQLTDTTSQLYLLYKLQRMKLWDETVLDIVRLLQGDLGIYVYRIPVKVLDVTGSYITIHFQLIWLFSKYLLIEALSVPSIDNVFSPNPLSQILRSFSMTLSKAGRIVVAVNQWKVKKTLLLIFTLLKIFGQYMVTPYE